MALIQCPECKREISDKAFACPHCGCPLQHDIPQLAYLEWNGRTYNISSIVQELDKCDLTGAGLEVFNIFRDEIIRNYPNHTSGEIEYEIWRQYIKLQETRSPRIKQTNIPLYKYGEYKCEIYRVFWWLERNDRVSAFKEIYFGFPYGPAANSDQEREAINRILQDIVRIYNIVVQNSHQIIYPEWFMAWKNHSMTSASGTQIGQQQTCIPRCPTCGSTNIQKVNVSGRAIGGLVFGRLSVEGRAQFFCKDCRYQW